MVSGQAALAKQTQTSLQIRQPFAIDRGAFT